MARTKEQRAADRAAAPAVLTELRDVIDANRAALAALPAAASRTPAQRKDALQARSIIALARAQLLSMGAARDNDRATTPA